MKRLTAPQAFKVLQIVKELIGKEKVFGENSYMESIFISDVDYDKLQEIITPLLGRKRRMAKPYFETAHPYWYDIKILKYRKLFEDIYGESWYYDGGDLVRGDKTIVHYKDGMTMRQLINKIQTTLTSVTQLYTKGLIKIPTI